MDTYDKMDHFRSFLLTLRVASLIDKFLLQFYLNSSQLIFIILLLLLHFKILIPQLPLRTPPSHGRAFRESILPYVVFS